MIEALAEILKTPAMFQALSVLTEEQLPKAILRADSPNLMENHALLNARREGYFEFLRNLKTLAIHKPQRISESDIAPWKHVSESQKV